MEKHTDVRPVEVPVANPEEIPAFLDRREVAAPKPAEVEVQTDEDVGGKEVTVH